MNITKRKYQEAFDLAEQISKQGLTVVKYTTDGKSTETELIKQGAAPCWYNEEFIEDEENLKLSRTIKKTLLKYAREAAIKDKDTKAPLFETNPITGQQLGFKMTVEDQAKYEEKVEQFLDEVIEWDDITVCICPKELFPNNEIPFQLKPLNGLTINHKFMEKPEPKTES